MMIKQIFTIIGCFVISFSLYAQTIERSVIASTGSSVEAGNIQLDFTVGEVAVETFENTTFVLTQGFHQGRFIPTGIAGIPFEVSYKIYPNPASEEVWISMEGPSLDFGIQLHDAVGHALNETKRWIKANGSWQEKLNVNHLASGTYLFVITNPKGEWLKSHKVIINNH